MTSTSGSEIEIPSQPQQNATFNSPWEAQVFALAVRLQETGVFTRDSWTRALAAEIQQANQRNDPDLGDTYYHHWTRALEQVLINASLVDEREIQERVESWREAYANTPHGHAVVLPLED